MKNIKSLLAISTITFASFVFALAPHIQFWPFELIVSFTPLMLYALFGCIIIIALVLLCMRTFLASQIVVAVLMLGSTLTAYSLGFALHVQPVVSVTRSSGKPTVTFVTFNREFSNDTIDPAGAYLKTQHADVIALEETNPDVTERISQQSGLGYFYNADRLNTVQNTSTALVSRYPILSSSTIMLSDQSSMVRAVVTVPNKQTYAFYALHLTGPFSQDHYANRIKDSVQVADIINREQLPVVLGGDFNTTIFSPSLQKFNVATLGKVHPTTTTAWPECSRYSSIKLTCLRIDHVYIPLDAKLTGTRLSPELGSDHRALTTIFE